MSRPVTSTEHGEYGYARRHKCQCAPCKDVVAKYAKRLKLDHERGHRRLIDATPVRAHLQQLIADGASVPQIASAAGLSRAVVKHIVWGKDGITPAGRCHRDTAAKLRRLTHEALSPHAHFIPNVGLRRRLDALEYLGHTKADLAEALGVTVAIVFRWLEVDRCLSSTVERVHRAYVQLRKTEGTNNQVRWRAYRRNARPWMCWDDETIDDPHAEPYDACCLVSHCTRAVEDKSLCGTHLRPVKKAGGYSSPRVYRQTVLRLNRLRKQDGTRTRAQVADLRELGYGDDAITSYLRLSDDYVARLRRKEAS